MFRIFSFNDCRPYWRLIALPVASGICLGGALTGAAAQIGPGPANNVPPPNTQLSAQAGQINLGSNFLQRTLTQATSGYAQRENSGGGGASQSSQPLIYRSWFEAYGTSATTAAQGLFPGDRRDTVGGVAGIGMTLAPGFSAGFSVDQSRTRIGIFDTLQNANLDLTQLGVNAAYTSGAWTLAGAAVHGFASIDARRATGGGTAFSNYGGRIDGALAELSYYKAFGESRIVPKLAVEYVTGTTNAYQEVGGTTPATVAQAFASRARVLAGAEVGHYWIADQRIIDISAYGKFVDNFFQSANAVAVSAGGATINVQGIRESNVGADAGAALSVGMTSALRLYANYDGRYRSNFNSHQGTLGLEVKW